MSQRIEIYMGSFSNKPIIRNLERDVRINIGDEFSQDDWLNLLDTSDGELELKVKVADVRHLFWDNDDCQHSLNIKVVPVD